MGPYRSQTFTASLRSHGLAAQWILNAPTNGHIFEAWGEIQLAPTGSEGDINSLDNVAFRKNERTTQLVWAKGAWLFILPP